MLKHWRDVQRRLCHIARKNCRPEFSVLPRSSLIKHKHRGGWACLEQRLNNNHPIGNIETVLTIPHVTHTFKVHRLELEQPLSQSITHTLTLSRCVMCVSRRLVRHIALLHTLITIVSFPWKWWQVLKNWCWRTQADVDGGWGLMK